MEKCCLPHAVAKPLILGRPAFAVGLYLYRRCMHRLYAE